MYEVNGVTGHGDMPEIAGTKSGPAIVLAGAACVWNDVRSAFAFFRGWDFINEPYFNPPCDVFAVNDIGVYFRPPLQHLVSHHESELEHYVVGRRIRIQPTLQKEPMTHTCHGFDNCGGHARADIRWRFVSAGAGGTSTLLAVGVALALGHDRIMLCGAPMDGGAYFFGPPWEENPDFNSRTLEIDWIEARDHWLDDRVKSFSGRTADWLGKPTRRWLDDSRD